MRDLAKFRFDVAYDTRVVAERESNVEIGVEPYFEAIFRHEVLYKPQFFYFVIADCETSIGQNRASDLYVTLDLRNNESHFSEEESYSV